MASRAFALYYDVYTRKIYGASGAELANENLPYIAYKEQLALTLQLITSSTITDKYSTSGVTACEAAIDDDWTHYYEGALTAGKSGAVIAITADGFTSPDAYSTGTLYLQNAAWENETVDYTAYSLANGVYTFTVAATLTYAYAENDTCRLIAHPLIAVANSAITKTDAATGKFIIALDAHTQPFQRAINGKEEIVNCKFGFFALDNTGDDVISVLCAFKCKNRLIDTSVIGPAPADDYYTKTQIDAMIHGKVLTLTSAPTPTTTLASIDADAPIGSWGFFEGYKYTWIAAAAVVRDAPESSW